MHAGNSPAAQAASSFKTAPANERPRYCDRWRALIEAKRAGGLTAQRIYQDLVAEHGFARSYSTVQRYVRRLELAAPLPFRRLECAPGEEAQIDFGVGAPIVAEGGRRRKTHVLRIVLSHSRKAYSEAVDRQTTDNFIRCLENAFAHLGGVPQALVIDNLKAAVTQADWYDPELNPKLRAFADHYGVAILPTRPRTPRHKGKIKRGVGYVQSNALKGRRFASLAAQNEFLLEWETSVADCRIHGTTRRQVGLVFREIELPALRPLPAERFPLFHEAQRIVHRDGHVSVERAYYSVPVENLTSTVWVRWDARLVRVFNHRLEQIAIHAKQPPGKFSTQRAHIAAEKINGVERGAAWLLMKASSLGFLTSDVPAWRTAILVSRQRATPWSSGYLTLTLKKPPCGGPLSVRHHSSPALLHGSLLCSRPKEL
jgi:transposase